MGLDSRMGVPQLIFFKGKILSFFLNQLFVKAKQIQRSLEWVQIKKVTFEQLQSWAFASFNPPN